MPSGGWLSDIMHKFYRRRSSASAKNKNDFSVSANMAYGEVNLKPRETEGEYENPDTLLKPSGPGTESIATTNMYDAMDTNNPEYASTEEAMCATHHSSWIHATLSYMTHKGRKYA